MAGKPHFELNHPMTPEDKEKLVYLLRDTIFREFKSKYWLTTTETIEVLRVVYDRALLGIT
jgi:hypothetical protein